MSTLVGVASYATTLWDIMRNNVVVRGCIIRSSEPTPNEFFELRVVFCMVHHQGGSERAFYFSARFWSLPDVLGTYDCLVHHDFSTPRDFQQHTRRYWLPVWFSAEPEVFVQGRHAPREYTKSIPRQLLSPRPDTQGIQVVGSLLATDLNIYLPLLELCRASEHYKLWRDSRITDELFRRIKRWLMGHRTTLRSQIGLLL